MRAVRRSTALAVLLLFVAACASSPPVRQFQTIETCKLSAQASVKAFKVIYQSEKAKDPALWADRYDKAEAAYQSFQKIALAAVDASASGGDQTLILAAVNEALNQLVTLLATYGVR